jgi:hypothetical protein
MKQIRSASNPKTRSHTDRNTQQAKAVVKENHDKAPAGSNQTLRQHSEAFHTSKLKFLTFERLPPPFREK